MSLVRYSQVEHCIAYCQNTPGLKRLLNVLQHRFRCAYSRLDCISLQESHSVEQSLPSASAIDSAVVCVQVGLLQGSIRPCTIGEPVQRACANLLLAQGL